MGHKLIARCLISEDSTICRATSVQLDVFCAVMLDQSKPIKHLLAQTCFQLSIAHTYVCVLTQNVHSVLDRNYSNMSSRPPAKRRRVELTIEKKIDLIKESESVPKPTLKILSEKYGVGVSTVSDNLKKKIVYKEDFEKNLNPTKLRTNTCKFYKVNELVWSWFTQSTCKEHPCFWNIYQREGRELIKM